MDLKNAQPVRPGSPASHFGVPEGASSKDRVTISEVARNQIVEPIGRQNPKEVARSRMVGEITRKFFDTRLDNAPSVTRGEKSILEPVTAPPSSLTASPDVMPEAAGDLALSSSSEGMDFEA